MTGLRSAVAFLTPLPVGATAPGPSTLAWFPIVGAGLGLAVGGLWWVAGEAFPPAVAAAVALTAGAAVTGALHLDGLADSADGLLPHLDGPERRRAVMAAPDVGAFGVVVVVVALLLQWAALASLDPDPLLVAGIWCASRTAMAVALRTSTYVGGGLGSAFLAGGTIAPAGALGLAGSAALVVAAHRWPGAVALGAGAVGASGVVAAARRRLGGVTGDVMGAAGVVLETLALVVASARW